MKCRKIQRTLSAFLDGELSEKKAMHVAEHLSRCPTCQQEATSLSSAWEALGEIREVDPSPYFWTRLSGRIAQVEERRFGGVLHRLLVPAAVIAASVAGFWIGGTLYDLYREDPLEASEKVVTSLHVDALDDFPAESIGLAYMQMVSNQGE